MAGFKVITEVDSQPAEAIGSLTDRVRTTTLCLNIEQLKVGDSVLVKHVGRLPKRIDV